MSPLRSIRVDSFRVALSIALLTAVAFPGTAGRLSAQTPDGFEARWESIVTDHRATLDSAGIVGATLAFVADGEIVAVDYYGLADIRSGRPVDERTIFHWASVTKTLTAVAVMQARDRGLLALEDPIVEYVPELRGVHNPHGSMEDVTIRHLLSHSAGFRNSTWPWDEGADWQPFEPTEWSQLAAMIPYTEIRFPPGSRYAYSNPGIIFVARALEHVTGDVYEAYVDKNIFDALGLGAAYFDATPWRLREDRSDNYRIVEGRAVAGGPEFNTGVTVSNGGLNATVADLGRWTAFLMGAPDDRASVHENVLPRATLEEMWHPVVAVEDSSSVLGPVHMGLSFFLSEVNGRRLVGHTGSQKSFRSFLLVDPEADVATIAVYNTAGGDDTAPDTDAIMQEYVERTVLELFPLFQVGVGGEVFPAWKPARG